MSGSKPLDHKTYIKRRDELLSAYGLEVEMMSDWPDDKAIKEQHRIWLIYTQAIDQLVLDVIGADENLSDGGTTNEFTWGKDALRGIQRNIIKGDK